jgi:hypothetical protein
LPVTFKVGQEFWEKAVQEMLQHFNAMRLGVVADF